MNKLFDKFLLAIVLLGVTVLFSACGSDDDDIPTLEEHEYKVEITYEGDMDNYHKTSFLGGGALSSQGTNLFDDVTGKELTTNTLTDSNYTFSEYNKFSFSRKMTYLSILITATPSSLTKPTGNLKVTVKVYQDGKLIKTTESTGTPEKRVEISQQFGVGI